jgi:hypothetical protein
MKRTALILFLVSLFVVSVSCTRQASYTVTAAYDDKILVTSDKETMEYLIDCSITRDCTRIPMMKLAYEGKVFYVESGTTVEIRYNLFSSDARKGQIMSGEHTGQYCWVYDRMLSPDRSNKPYQLAFAQMCQTTIK